MTVETSAAPGWPAFARRLVPVIVTGLGILAAIALAWWIGPLVAFGGARPFEPASMRWVLTAGILLAVLGAACSGLIRVERENRRLLRALSSGGLSPAAS